MRAYVDDFRRALLHVHDAAPAEILDRFLRGLQPTVRQHMLVAAPTDFVAACLVAEHVAGAAGEPARAGLAAPPSSGGGYAPMELGTLNVPPRPAAAQRASHPAQNSGQGSQCLCHYCK